MKKETLVLGGIGLLTLIILVGAAFLMGNSSAQPAQKTVADKALLLGTKPHYEGSPSAKVTIVEYGDFQCPACGAAHPTVRQIINDYKDKIYFVFRNFPLPMHQNARVAAAAAEAAGVVGGEAKYWEMHNKLYDTQDEWSESRNAPDIFAGYAKDLGLDVDAFKKAETNKSTLDTIQKDENDGLALGINSTPTFFINGEEYPAVMDYNTFKQKIDAVLK
jgi:protein-disulfide isomerase